MHLAGNLVCMDVVHRLCAVGYLHKPCHAYTVTIQCMTVTVTNPFETKFVCRSCAVRPFMREACLAARLLHHAQHAAVALESNQEALLDKHGASGCVPLQNVFGLSGHMPCLHRAVEPQCAQVCLLSVHHSCAAFSGCIHTPSVPQLVSFCIYQDAQCRFGRTSVTA